ncbi:MAG TPA: hypothetical protein P5256_00190 [Beijerinckiaceae bacterium]|nr:hypothetical protein [Rhodoblastus sp.]MCB1533332.1 hypothetical protein [Rhodoblastus sp.]MCC2108462.1 hypothetical protein [Hyphomicrobiales bacterium]HRY01514.1 hypothetical protein [Beijerinckiaceae bacterium]
MDEHPSFSHKVAKGARIIAISLCALGIFLIAQSLSHHLRYHVRPEDDLGGYLGVLLIIFGALFATIH